VNHKQSLIVHIERGYLWVKL